MGFQLPIYQLVRRISSINSILTQNLGFLFDLNDGRSHLGPCRLDSYSKETKFDDITECNATDNDKCGDIRNSEVVSVTFFG